MRRMIPILLLAGLLVFLAIWRVRVGLTRFFDVDEFTYLHWAANVARGQIPYRDFFLCIPPGFFWIFGLLVRIAGVGSQVFVAGRVVTLAIFFVMTGLVALLFGITRSWRWAILAAAIFAFLPMPYDKFLELRPDNLATLLALAGLVLETILLTRTVRRNFPFVLLGVFYAASLLVLPKTLPFAAVGIGVFLISNWKKTIPVLAGFFAPFLFFLLWLLGTGTFSAAWYGITRFPFEAYFWSPWAPMEPNLFFYPNAAFYGGAGYGITLGLVANHALWIVAIAVGVFRLVTPFITSKTLKQTNVFAELLISGTFVLSVVGYVKFFPLRHAQYLIPIAVFIAYYAADGLAIFFDWLARVGAIESLAIVLAGFAYVLVMSSNETNPQKLFATNASQLASIPKLLATVPLTDHVLDLEGRMLFWQDAYSICCLSFGTFVPHMSRRPEPLTTVLERDRVPYIYVGDSGGRLSAFDQTDYGYIQSHYVQVDGWAGELWKRK